MRTLFVSLLAMPGMLRAQGAAFSLDAGSSRMRFADSLETTALSLTPTVRLLAPRAMLTGFGTVSQMSGASTQSGTLDGVLFSPTRGVWSAELEGIAGGSSHSDGTRTGQMMLLGRANVIRAGRGAWFGGGAGRTWDGSWRGVLQGDLGVWMTRGSFVGSISGAPTVVDDTIKYTDANVALHREVGVWELNGSLGMRAGAQLPTLPANRNVWGNVGATFWLAPQVGLVGSAGSYPVDFTQGFPGGQYVSLSLRFRAQRAEAAEHQQRTVPHRPVIGRIDVRRVSGSTRRLRLAVPNARSVELIGDFTNWTPVALVRDAGGWWSATMSIPAGTHEMNVRVDGGSWSVPLGLTSFRDEFGGVVGLLVVP